MRAKKSEMEDDYGESRVEDVPEESQPKDIKLGEIQLKESSVLVVKKTNYKGNDRIDFRVWLNSARYKGPTRQGFALPMDKIDEFVGIVEKMKERIKKNM